MPPSANPDDESPTSDTRPTDLTTYTPFTPPPDCPQTIHILQDFINAKGKAFTLTASPTCLPPSFKTETAIITPGIEAFFDSLTASYEKTTPCPTDYAFAPQPTGKDLESGLLRSQYNRAKRRYSSTSSSYLWICCPSSSTITITDTRAEPSTAIETKHWVVDYKYGHCSQVDGGRNHPVVRHAVAHFRQFPKPNEQSIVETVDGEDGAWTVQTNVVVSPGRNYTQYVKAGERVVWPLREYDDLPPPLKGWAKFRDDYNDGEIVAFVVVFMCVGCIASIVLVCYFASTLINKAIERKSKEEEKLRRENREEAERIMTERRAEESKREEEGGDGRADMDTGGLHDGAQTLSADNYNLANDPNERTRGALNEYGRMGGRRGGYQPVNQSDTRERNDRSWFL